MSLPENIIFPLRSSSDDSPENKYLTDLIYELTNMYERIAENVNGSIRNNADVTGAKWTPTLQGSTSGSFTYSSQIGWSLRQGLFSNVWFDITWSATTASGNLYVELPYKVTKSSQTPFVGVIQDSSMTYTGGYSKLVINGIPNTYRGEIWECGDGVATQNKPVEAAGRLIGHIFYIGLEDE